MKDKTGHMLLFSKQISTKSNEMKISANIFRPIFYGLLFLIDLSESEKRKAVDRCILKDADYLSAVETSRNSPLEFQTRQHSCPNKTTVLRELQLQYARYTYGCTNTICVYSLLVFHPVPRFAYHYP